MLWVDVVHYQHQYLKMESKCQVILTQKKLDINKRHKYKKK